MRFVSPSQLDKNNIGTWPIYYKVPIWIAIIAIISFLFDQFMMKEPNELQIANQTTIDEHKKTYKQLYQDTLNLDQYKKRSNELIDQLNSLLKFLPLKTETAQLIDSVYNSAIESELSINGFTPKEKMDRKEYYDIYSISLNTTTYFANFSQFAERLTRLERIMNISDFSLNIMPPQNKKDGTTPSFGENALLVIGQLQTYIYNQDIEKLRKGELPEKMVQP